MGRVEFTKDDREVYLDAYDKCTGNCEKCPCINWIHDTNITVCGLLGSYNNKILKQINLLLEKL